ncbi:UNVERIFIED_CONTAM: hypothetical protein Cloal_1876 [Acetivibrio alkalicellulosi]
MELREIEVLEISNKKKVWNPTTLKLMCVFLGTFSAMPLYILNFYRLDHPKKQQNTIIGVGVSIITIGLVFIIPEGTIISLLMFMFMFMFNIGVAIHFSSEQKVYFQTFIENGGKKASSLLAWILGIFILVTFIIIVGIIFIFLEKKGLITL